MTDADKVEELIRRLLEGETLRAAGKDVFGDLRKLHAVRSKNRELDLAISKAMELRCDVFADEIIKIADTEPDPQKARNMISARMWHTSKLMPRKYGDRLELAVQHAISITEALATARGRLLPRESSPILDAEIVTPTLQDPVADPTAGLGDRFPSIFD